MGFAVTLSEEQFKEVATDVIGNIVAEATVVMQRKLQAAGYVLSGELLNSLRHQSVVVARDLYAEFSIGFAGYGRFKDMRNLLYGKLPPVEVMEEYVRDIGLDKFKYVPGYLLGAKYRVLHIPDTRAINRIAWGIAINRLNKGVKLGKNRNAFYNPTRGKLIYETGYKLLGSMPEPILKVMKAQFL
ncbi:hypothetical protein [Spirosoma agri]|uniref:Uncharacterized protein n=1 Tax=Spirosoma agri TaxID=1987381 RepID=A0A6M0IFL4_9BACT|nr:hypothetical protein [Spirosoma agri]NEU67056.1 hypothetical protein [Spirosoma agri]